MMIFDFIAAVYIWPIKMIRPLIIRCVDGMDRRRWSENQIIFVLCPILAYLGIWAVYQEFIRGRSYLEWSRLALSDREIEQEMEERLERLERLAARQQMVRTEAKVDWKHEGF